MGFPEITSWKIKKPGQKRPDSLFYFFPQAPLEQKL